MMFNWIISIVVGATVALALSIYLMMLGIPTASIILLATIAFSHVIAVVALLLE